MGVLPAEKYLENVKKGINGLLRYAVDNRGNVYGVCRGSECSMDYRYYMNLETAFNDDHGTGIILSSLAQFLTLDRGYNI